jgi:hypothetical protein
VERELRRQFADFIGRVHGRLEAGAEQYGEASFRRPVGELAGEIEEELLDVCGWAFILWTRVRRLRGVLGGGEIVCFDKE